MIRNTRKGSWLAGAMLALVAGGAHSVVPWWNPDYSNRVAVTVTNNDAVATPTPSSAEINIPVTSRADKNDVRAIYYNGATNTEIDSKIFRENPSSTPWIVENASAGSTGYNSLPAGTLTPPTLVNGDDGGVTVTLPFSFPFGTGSYTQVFLSIDGYLVPGSDQPIGLYGRGNATRAGIYPYTSDYTVAVAGGGMYVATDNNGPGGTPRAIFRWEVAESGQTAIIAKFAAILYANGDIRYVYSNMVTPPGTGVGGPTSYGEMSYGVEFGNNSNGVVHFPTDNYPTSADLSNHADILYTNSGNPRVSESSRVVFRLQQPIPAAGADTGHYYVYYNNPSPQTDQKRNVKNVFDETLDFESETLDTAATKWNPLEGGAMTVKMFQGKKIGLLTSPKSHPQASVKPGALAKDYLNVELLSRTAAVGGGEREMAPMLRVPYDQAHADLLTDPVNGLYGGYGFAIYGFGDQYGFTSYINPTDAGRGPAEMFPNALTPDNGNNNEFNTILFRVTGDPGLLSAKYWKEGAVEPIGWQKTGNRATGAPAHGAITDPVYNVAGGTGIAGYSQPIGVDYISLRELRNLTSAAAAQETQVSPGPFIQGVLSSTKLGVLAGAPVTVTSGVNTYTLLTATDGSFKVTLPAGTYTVSASAAFHLPANVTAVAPTAAGITNLVLTFVGATISGVCREFPTNKRSGGATVVLTDATTGDYVTETVTDANGNYSVMAPAGGSFYVSSIGTAGHGTRGSATVASAGSATVNLLGTLVGNGDCEAPDSSNAYPKGWSNMFDAPGAYVYSKAFNHTPGGHWSVGITDGGNPSGWNAPPAGFYNWPVMADTFDVTSSVWVYFTQAGQLARLRLRNNFPLGGIVALSGDVPDPNNEDQTPGNLDAGKVPVGRWYHIQITHKVGDPGLTAALDPPGWNNNLYVYGLGKATQGKTATAGGTVYFDDFGFTLTPKASALAKVVDSYGTPVPNAYVGLMDDGSGGTSGIGANNFLAGPYSFTDDAGNATLYTLAAGAINVGAWIPQPILKDTTTSDTGVIAGTAAATASANPTVRATIALSQGTNVAKGITNITAHELIGVDLNLANLPLTVDGKLNTGWYSTDAPEFPYVVTWNLGAVKSVNQIEFWYERTEPDYDVYVGTTADPSAETNSKVAAITGASNKGIPEADFAPTLTGKVKIIKFSAPKNIQYIQLYATGTGPSNNASQFLYEMRALSAAVPPPVLTKADAATALKIAAGIQASAPADVLKLDVVKADGTVGSDGRITTADAQAIAKRAL